MHVFRFEHRKIKYFVTQRNVTHCQCVAHLATKEISEEFKHSSRSQPCVLRRFFSLKLYLMFYFLSPFTKVASQVILNGAFRFVFLSSC